MLSTKIWMNCAEGLMVEFQQATDEGKDVSKYRKLCEEISAITGSEEAAEMATSLKKLLDGIPVSADYPYNEPSDLAGIRAVRPQKRDVVKKEVSGELRDKIMGAWAGRIAGCLLGGPVEGFKRDRLTALLKATSNYPMSRYITSDEFSDAIIKELDLRINSRWADRIPGSAPIDDDTNYTVMSLKILEAHGRDFTPVDVMESWLAYLPMFSCCTAERVAYSNGARGMLPPDTATYNNPYREWIGAQIRVDFYGYINPGDPETAAEMAWRDASVSHIKNGIYSSMFISAMIACAFISDDIMQIIEWALQEIPEKCRLRDKIMDVLAWHRDGLSAHQVIDKIHEVYDENNGHHWCHAISNTMIVIAALLYGEGDFTKSICLAVQAALDTDCNGASVGSIVGAMLGKSGIPPYWYERFDLTMDSAILGYNRVSVNELVDKTLALVNNIQL